MEESKSIVMFVVCVCVWVWVWVWLWMWVWGPHCGLEILLLSFRGSSAMARSSIISDVTSSSIAPAVRPPTSFAEALFFFKKRRSDAEVTRTK